MKNDITTSAGYSSYIPVRACSRFEDLVTKKMGFCFAILANILWGSSFLASKFTLVAWKPFTASSIRFGIATVALAFFMKVLGRKIEIPKNLKEWLGISMLATSSFGILYPLQLTGLKYINSSFSAGIMLTSPMIVLVLNRLIFRDALSVKKWIALAFGFAGGAILLSSSSPNQSLSFSSETLWGGILTLSSSFFLALSVILTKNCSKNLSPASLTFWAMGIGFIELTIAACFFEGNILRSFSHEISLFSWMSMFFLALVCSAFCFFLWNFSLANSTPQEIASSMHIKTPTAVLIGIVIAGEVVTGEIITGTFLVMFGVWLSQSKVKV